MAPIWTNVKAPDLAPGQLVLISTTEPILTRRILAVGHKDRWTNLRMEGTEVPWAVHHDDTLRVVDESPNQLAL